MRNAPVILPVFTTSVPLDFRLKARLRSIKKQQAVGGDGED